MKHQVIYSLKSRSLNTQLQKRTREKIKEKKNHTYILALSFVQRLSFLDLGHQNHVVTARETAPKNGVKPLSVRGHGREVFLWRY